MHGLKPTSHANVNLTHECANDALNSLKIFLCQISPARLSSPQRTLINPECPRGNHDAEFFRPASRPEERAGPPRPGTSRISRPARDAAIFAADNS